MKKTVVFIVLLFTALCASGEVRLPRLVSDGMILQREAPLRLWGWAAPGEEIHLGFRQTTYTTTADPGGNWSVALPPQKAGGPYQIRIQAGNTLTINDVLFGDVWLCSGQSNMETPVSRVMTLFGDAIRNYSNPHIRYVKIPLTYNFHGEQTDVAPCSWVDITPETAQTLAALPYFFAREMYEKTGVPVGILNSSVGGSPVEAWIGEAALQAYPVLLNDMRICRSDEFIADMQRLSALPGIRWNEVLNAEDQGLQEDWSSPGYDDTAWETTDLFDNSWGRKGFRPRNGAHWFRKEIDVPEEMAHQEAMLYMGRIIDADRVYVNGRLAGTTGYQYPPRNYPLPAGMLKAGKNQISVRLTSQGGIPGFVEGKQYAIVAGGQTISLEGEWKYKLGAEMPLMTGGGVSFQNKPTGLYNAMISPLKNFPLKGIIWYQGESNTNNYDEYYGLMVALINDWRSLWEKGDELPFFIVQLPNYMEPAYVQQNSHWAALRDVQLKLSQTIPNTALAVAIDLGEANDIHPLNKKDLAKRLSLQARRIVYGEKIVSEGPVFESYETNGSKLILSFREGTNDLKPVNELKGFALAGTDDIFHPAKAVIEGKKVVVWHDTITQPQAVCYAWANNPEGANLSNRSDLPASPFRTK
ncbi:MAG: beta galactosidase jelly roll domain-containing protein [Tannerellaceae bacterium]|jgi:sialate O-acetylesterase|nr:beta galactosidase jelly roll domain-containing protein [Tannerellaceae bacterium]